MMGSTMTAAIWRGILGKQAGNRFQIVELRHQRVLHRIGGNSTRSRYLVGPIGIAAELELGLHAYQDRVVHAVVGALHLDDLVAAGKAARDADRVHGHFRTAAAKAYLLHREALANLIRQVVLQGVRHAVHGAGDQPLLHRGDHRRMAVPGHQRAETKIEIDVLIAIEVVNVASLGIFHKQGPGLVTAEVAGYAKRHARFCPLERSARAGGTGFKAGEFFLKKVVHGILPLPRGRSIVKRAGRHS